MGKRLSQQKSRVPRPGPPRGAWARAAATIGGDNYPGTGGNWCAACASNRSRLAESAKGPLWAKVACCRVYRADDEQPLWLFVRKNEDGTIKYALSNAPEDTSFKTLCQVSVMRWPIEQCFQEGKSQLGMNQYEHRSSPAWHRHMLYVFLALHFLMALRLRLKKSPDTDAAPGAAVIGIRTTAEIPDTKGCRANRALPLETQPGGLCLSS